MVITWKMHAYLKQSDLSTHLSFRVACYWHFSSVLYAPLQLQETFQKTTIQVQKIENFQQTTAPVHLSRKGTL